MCTNGTIESALELLSDYERSVFVSRADGHTFPQIASWLGKETKTVEHTYRRALTKVSRHLLTGWRPKTPTSRHRGVSYYQRDRKWRACLHLGGGRYKFLGYHDTEEEAAQAVEDYLAEQEGR